MSDERSGEPEKRPKELLLRNEVISEALLEFHERAAEDATAPVVMPVVIELNLQHSLGLAGAVRRLDAVWRKAIRTPRPELISEIYCLAELTLTQVQALVQEDMTAASASARAIYRIWPDFPVEPLIDKSCSTVKADAARRSYDAAGRGIVWAVIDSGIDQGHPHFRQYGTLTGDVKNLHKDFTRTGDALTDGLGPGRTSPGSSPAGSVPVRPPGRPRKSRTPWIRRRRRRRSGPSRIRRCSRASLRMRSWSA